MKKIITALLFFILSTQLAFARKCELPEPWKNLCPLLAQRVAQKDPKMKLSEDSARALEIFLINTPLSPIELSALQENLPKTTLELLMAVKFRNVSFDEAESMAHYLHAVVQFCQFKNAPAFDNNTSHIIGREWHEIDYSGEGMTWQKQKQHYSQYGVVDFKRTEHLKKFFPVESKPPYFIKIYKPQGCHFNDE